MERLCQPSSGLILQALVQAPFLHRTPLAVRLPGAIDPVQAAARAPAHPGQGKRFSIGAAEAIAVLMILEVLPAEFYARVGLVLSVPDTVFCRWRPLPSPSRPG